MEEINNINNENKEHQQIININDIKIETIRTNKRIFKTFYIQRLNDYKTKQYKKVLNDLIYCQLDFDDIKEKYNLNILKIKSMSKIIKHKIKKYEKYLTYNQKCESENKSPGKHKNIIVSKIDNLYNMIYMELETLIITYFKNQNSFNTFINDGSSSFYLDLIEKIVYCFLSLLHLKAYHQEKLGQIILSFSYLSIADKLIKKYSKHMKHGRTISMAKRIYLKISKFLLINLSLKNCQLYINDTISLCKKEIFIREKNIDWVNDVYTLKSHQNEIATFLVALIYITIIHENHGNYSQSSRCYKLILTLAKHLLGEKYHILSSFINKLTKRSTYYNGCIQLIIKIKKKLEFENLKRTEMSKYESSKKKKKNYSYYHVEEKLSKLTIPEIRGIDKNILRTNRSNKSKRTINNNYSSKPDDEKIVYSDYFLSNKKLIDAFYTNEFKHYIYKEKQVYVLPCDIDKREEIERLIKFIDKKKIDNFIKGKYHITYDKLQSRNAIDDSKDKNKSGNPQIDIDQIKKAIEDGKSSMNINSLNNQSPKSAIKDKILGRNRHKRNDSNFIRHMSYQVNKASSELNNTLDPNKITFTTTKYAYFYDNPNRCMSSLSYKTDNKSNIFNKRGFKIPKYKHSRYHFQYAPSFFIKKKIIDNLDNKENDFQKKLLDLKKIENIGYLAKNKTEKEELEEYDLKYKLIKLSAENNLIREKGDSLKIQNPYKVYKDFRNKKKKRNRSEIYKTNSSNVELEYNTDKPDYNDKKCIKELNNSILKDLSNTIKQEEDNIKYYGSKIKEYKYSILKKKEKNTVLFREKRQKNIFNKGLTRSNSVIIGDNDYQDVRNRYKKYYDFMGNMVKKPNECNLDKFTCINKE